MIEKLLEIINPDTCLVCSIEGKCICDGCANERLILKKPACFLCNQINENGKTCKNCYSKSKISASAIAYRYEDVVKKLIWSMKYENKRNVARFFAHKLQKYDGVVCYVPSDGKTRRSRGYDQAEIIARTYAKINNLDFQKILIRTRHSHQVGKNRVERIKNIQGNFLASKNVEQKKVILIDDVITTGATVSECARILKKAGAKSINVVAIAKG